MGSQEKPYGRPSSKGFLGKLFRKRSLLLRVHSPDSTSTSFSNPTTTQSKDHLPLGFEDSGFLKSFFSNNEENDFIDDDDEIYDQDSSDEPELNDVQLGSPLGFYSDESLENVSNDDVSRTRFLAESEAGESAAWKGIPYEALFFPKIFRSSKKSNKSPRLLENLFLAQELSVNDTPEPQESDDTKDSSDAPSSEKPIEDESNAHEILVMEFSRDGKYLAVAGRDARIVVWQVISSPLSRLQFKNQEAERRERKSRKKGSVFPYAPVFHHDPVQIFEGHTRSILSLDWSKNNFLVSGSMDKTVKIWNIERLGCLETYQHEDFVTAVKFHPNDDRFFLSGSLDNCLRLWSVMESSVAFTSNLGEEVLITALAFSPMGNHCVAGGFNGSLFALETQGLQVIQRVEIKEHSIPKPFHHKNDNKVTGIKVFVNEAADDVLPMDLKKWNVLVTTNDSKVRLIDLRLKKLVTRFKGCSNTSSSIVASLSEDNKYIISGSEDHWCYIWENNNSIINNKLRIAMKDLLLEGKSHVNDKHRLLSKFIHENGIMRKLNVHHFLEDKHGHAYVANENNSYTSFHAHSKKVNVAIFAPDNTRKLLEYSDDVIFDLCKRKDQILKSGILSSKTKTLDFPESSGLNEGHIIVTSDSAGNVRVFRQDSAHLIRKSLVDIRKKQKSKCSDSTSITGSASLDRAALSIATSRFVKRGLSPVVDSRETMKHRLSSVFTNRNSAISPSETTLIRLGSYKGGDLVPTTSPVGTELRKRFSTRDHVSNYIPQNEERGRRDSPVQEARG